MMYVSLIIISTIVIFAHTIEMGEMSGEQTFVDIIVSDYFKTEQNLWTMIENRADNVLLQVYKTHENFFNRTISESASGIFMRDFLPTNDPVVQVAANLNSTAELGYNHLREQELDRKTITDYANYSLKILKDASDLIDLTMQKSFWEKLLNDFNECHSTGAIVQASHQLVYDFYRDIQSGLLKSYITSQMSYMILAYYNNNGKSYREESDILRSTFESRFKRVRETVRQYIHGTRREVWRCDEEKNSANSWHTEVTNFLQGFVDNEANLNPKSSCVETCSIYENTKHFQCQEGSLCDRNENNHDAAKCNGIIRNCQEIDDSEITICEIAGKNRRYNYIKYSSDTIIGDSKAVCDDKLLAKSWIRWFVKCSNCICLCDEVNSKKSDRYFSLRPVESNIADNKIVTGVMLTKQNGVIHLAISERILLPFGQAEVLPPYPFIDTWRGTDFFNINNNGIRENVDYYTLSYENRSINLDYVTAPKDHLVTGVRFRITDGRITIEIRATEFDFVNGRLKNIDKSEWYSNPNCGQVKIDSQDRRENPMKISKMSLPDPRQNTFIEFGPTDYTTDVSQLTVPFIDTQRVEPYTPVALSGVGLYFKNAVSSGGFIAPRIFVYDFEPYIDAE